MIQMAAAMMASQTAAAAPTNILKPVNGQLANEHLAQLYPTRGNLITVTNVQVIN